MIPLRFDKDRAAQVLQCIRDGEPIPPGGNRPWSFYDMLTTAGALMFCCVTHGPDAVSAMGARHFCKPDCDNPEHDHSTKLADLTPEHREAVEESFLATIHQAVGYCAILSQQVADGDFDDTYDQRVEVMLSTTGEAPKTTIRPVAGFKGKTS